MSNQTNLTAASDLLGLLGGELLGDNSTTEAPVGAGKPDGVLRVGSRDYKVLLYDVNEWDMPSAQSKMGVLCFAILGFCLCAHFWFQSIKHHQRQQQPADRPTGASTGCGSSPALIIFHRQVFLAGCALLNLSILTFWAEPSDEICMLRMLVPFCFSLTFLALMWVYFATTQGGRPRRPTWVDYVNGLNYFVFLLCTVTVAVVGFLYPPEPEDVLRAWGTNYLHARQYPACEVDAPRQMWRTIVTVEIMIGVMWGVLCLVGIRSAAGSVVVQLPTARTAALAMAVLSFCNVGYIVLTLLHSSRIGAVSAFFVCIGTVLSSALLPALAPTATPESGNQGPNSSPIESSPPQDDIELQQRRQDPTQKDTADDQGSCEPVEITDDVQSVTEKTSQSTSDEVETEQCGGKTLVLGRF